MLPCCPSPFCKAEMPLLPCCCPFPFCKAEMPLLPCPCLPSVPTNWHSAHGCPCSCLPSQKNWLSTHGCPCSCLPPIPILLALCPWLVLLLLTVRPLLRLSAHGYPCMIVLCVCSLPFPAPDGGKAVLPCPRWGQSCSSLPPMGQSCSALPPMGQSCSALPPMGQCL